MTTPADRSDQPPAYDVLLEGDYFCDLIFTGLPDMPRLGTEVVGTGFEMLPGGAFYPALAMHRLGLRTAWPANFGSDLFSQFVLDACRHGGIDDSLFRLHQRPLRLITVSLSFPHERAFVTFSDPPIETPLAPLVRQYRPRCVLLSGLYLGQKLFDVAAAAREVGALIYMDCQAHNVTLATPGVAEALRAVNIFAPNAAEALALTAEVEVEAALAKLADLTPVVVIKCGGEGVIARCGDQVFCEPALPISAVDTTGAGDCFNAGFLYAYLRCVTLEVCLRCGNICGGLSTTAHGGLAIPTAAQVEQWLAQWPQGVSS
jgi:sugar/nucleoside kinase (ribokinase family)